jgi:excisionase family DNA binding protein
MSADFDPTIDLLTIAEVAELLKISIPSVRRLQLGRLIPFIKVGGSVRFTRSDIVAYLRKKRVETIGESRWHATSSPKRGGMINVTPQRMESQSG